MAIKKPIERQDGTCPEYWKICTVQHNYWPDNRVSVIIGGFLNENVRNTGGKTPVEKATREYNLQTLTDKYPDVKDIREAIYRELAFDEYLRGGENC